MGSFIRGRWIPKTNDSCIAITGCFSSLEGINFTGTYTKQYFKRGNISLDIDATSMIGYQSTNQNYLNENINQDSSVFGVIGLIPTLRVGRLWNKLPIGIGIGVGPSYTIGTRVVDKPYNFSRLLTQVNAEISYPLTKDDSSSLILGLSHVCTSLGVLESNEGKTFGHHWYSLSYRRKI